MVRSIDVKFNCTSSKAVDASDCLGHQWYIERVKVDEFQSDRRMRKENMNVSRCQVHE